MISRSLIHQHGLLHLLLLLKDGKCLLTWFKSLSKDNVEFASTQSAFVKDASK